jgi:hypothetical protein
MKCEIYARYRTGSFTNHYIPYESNRSRALSEKSVLIPLLASIPLSLVTNIKSSQVKPTLNSLQNGGNDLNGAVSLQESS